MRGRSASSSRRTPSVWAWTSPMSASSCTRTFPVRSRAICRKPGARAGRRPCPLRPSLRRGGRRNAVRPLRAFAPHPCRFRRDPQGAAQPRRRAAERRDRRDRRAALDEDVRINIDPEAADADTKVKTADRSSRARPVPDARGEPDAGLPCEPEGHLMAEATAVLDRANLSGECASATSTFSGSSWARKARKASAPTS